MVAVTLLFNYLFVEPILTHKKGNVIFRIIHLIVISQQSGIKAWLSGVFFFFLCAKMDDGMIKLNLLNYSTWKLMMENLLYCKDLYKPVRLKEKPSNTLDEDWDVKHRKVIAYMSEWMDPTLHEHIYDETKADVVLKKLENLFARKTLRNKTTLIRRVVNLMYKDVNNMVEHISSFKDIVNKLVVMKMNIDDEMQAALLLSSLPDS